MASILTSIVVEWDKPIMISLFILSIFAIGFLEWPSRPLPGERKPFWRSFMIYGLGKWPSRVVPKEHEDFWGHIGLYGIFVIFICLHVIHMGMLLAGILIGESYELALTGWMALVICASYSTLFFLVFRKLVELKPSALRLTQLFLSGYPVFCLIIPLCCFFIISTHTGGIPSMKQDIDAWPYSHLVGSCIIAIPWILYFTLSPEVKKRFHGYKHNN